MKNICSLLLVMLCFGQFANAQYSFLTIDSIDINNINAAVLVHGDMWWNPITGIAHCNFPANAPTNINFAGALWMSGYDGGGQLHVAAQTYRQVGNDYWPGPLDNADTLTYATSEKWAHIWKVNRTDIQAFQAQSTHTTANTMQAILTWPGKGNSYAQGNGGAALSVTNDMAPFVDLNHDGIYQPLQGEYPDIKGDQALWWVFSDNGPTHDQTHARAVGVEVHAMAYAYKRNTSVDNIIYYDYSIVNRSANNYTNFRIGLHDDIDLGYYGDDYIGFDSVHRMGIAYNGASDDGASAPGGRPANSFGTQAPIVGVTMITLPGDAGSVHAAAGTFTTFNNDFSVEGNPVVDTEYDHYLRGKLRNGMPFVNTFHGAGAACDTQGTGTGTPTNYVYNGDPSNSAQWSECSCSNTPGDRRFVISSNDFTLSPGSTQHVVMALVTTNPQPYTTCPAFSSIEALADTAWNIYYNPLPVLGLSATATGNTISAYPNPAHDKLYIGIVTTTATHSVVVYNTLGQRMDAPYVQNGKTIEVDTHNFPAGLYSVLCWKDEATQTAIKFVKE